MTHTQALLCNFSRTILLWAWETFKPGIIASSSFQTQSVALLHMISQVCPEMEIIFVDTGYHFPETLTFRDALQCQLGLSVRTIQPASEGQQDFKQKSPLYRQNPDLCCQINKVEPMKQVLSGKKAWVMGLRREQTELRKHIQIVKYRYHEPVRICPFAEWTQDDLYTYIDLYQLPSHPLLEKDYLSIGCAPCTTPVVHGEDERSGRWAGSAKQECGLCTLSTNDIKPDDL
jgi:phosphoadenosine phosphosulfate reductase